MWKRFFTLGPAMLTGNPPYVVLVGILVAGGLILDIHLFRRIFIRRGDVDGKKPNLPPSIPVSVPDLLPLAWLLLALCLPVLLSATVPPANAPETAFPPVRMLLSHLVQIHLVPLLLVFGCLRAGQRSFGNVFLTGVSSPSAIRLGIEFGIALLPPAWLLSFATRKLLDTIGLDSHPQPVITWLSEGSVPAAPLLIILFMALVAAPAIEEMLFRGILFPLARSKSNRFGALLLSATLFALAHFHLPSFLPLVFLGIMLALAYRRTGNILTPMVMHAVFNGASVLLVYSFRPG